MTSANGGRNESGDAGGDRADGPTAPSPPTQTARAPASFWRHVRRYMGGCIASRADSASPPLDKGNKGLWGGRNTDAETWDEGGGDADSKQRPALRGLSIGRRWRQGKPDGGLRPLVAPPPSPTLTTAIRRRSLLDSERILAQLREARLIRTTDDVSPLQQPPRRPTGTLQPTAWTIDINDLQPAKMPPCKPIRLEKLNYTAEKQKVAAATMLRRKFERSEQLLESTERARRDKIARDNVRQSRVAQQKKRTTYETRDIEQRRSMKQAVANKRREQLKKENLRRLEKIAKRAARAKQRKDRLMEEDADNLEEIETIQYSDDDCCWDDRPPGRRGGSGPLVDVFFDQPVQAPGRVILGPLHLLEDGQTSSWDRLDDGISIDDDENYDDENYDDEDDNDDEKGRREMNATTTVTGKRQGEKTPELPADDACPATGLANLHLLAASDKPALSPRLKNRLHQPRVDQASHDALAATPTGKNRSPPDGAAHVGENGGLSGMTNAGGDCSVSGGVNVGVGAVEQTDVVTAPPSGRTDATNSTTKESDDATEEDRALTLATSTFCHCDDSMPTDVARGSPTRPMGGTACGETTPEQPKSSSPVAGTSTAATDRWRDTSPAQIRRRRV